MATIARIFLIGAGATAFVDLYSLARLKLLRIPPPNYALLGRWMFLLARGDSQRMPVTAAAPVRGEAAAGWMAHYLIGMAFAAIVPAFWGSSWLREPAI